MQFRYMAYVPDQGIVKGRLEAESQMGAREEIARLGYKPVQLAVVREAPSLEKLFPSLFRVNKVELTRICRQVGVIIESGGGLVHALEIVHKETHNRVLRRTLWSLRNALDGGQSLSDALQEHPKVFSPLFISIVAVGEQTGKLGPALQRMAEILEVEQEARDKALRTLMYPAAIMVMSLMTLFVLMTVALPPLMTVFDQMGTSVPGVTKAVIIGAAWFRDHLTQIGLGVGVALGAAIFLQRIPPVHYSMDVGKTHLPIIGPLLVASDLARFSRTMAMLLEAGVSLSVALSQGIRSTNNLALRRAFQEAEDSLLSGHGLAEALYRYPILPSMFRELVRIGEETNSLGRTLGDAASAYQKMVERRLNTILGMLEPISTLVVGGIVAFIAISMFLPIYSGLNAID